MQIIREITHIKMANNMIKEIQHNHNKATIPKENCEFSINIQ